MARPRREPYRLRQRGGIWQIVYTDEAGRTRRKSAGTGDYGAALNALADFQAEREAPTQAPLRLHEVIDRYKASRANRASADTIIAVCDGLKHAFGQLRPEQVTQERANAHANRRLADGKSRSTVYNDFIYLRAVVRFGIKHGLLPQDTYLPFEHPVRRSPPRERYVSKDEAHRLIEAAGKPHVRLFLVLGFMSGHRKEALLSLRWSQVDFEAGRIDFGVGYETKRRAVVPMNVTLRRELEYAWSVATTPYVIEYGSHHVTDVRAGLRNACKRAGIDPITPHVMRHSCATWLAQAGVSTREACRLLAMSEATFNNTYAKYHPDYLRGAADALDF